MNLKHFADKMASYDSPNMFNPYRDICPVHDNRQSPKLRRQNLTRYLTAASSAERVSMWVGRDLGYRGGRRTGISLTDEHHRELIAQTWNISLKQATVTEPQKEKTASSVWKFAPDIPGFVALWNIFPFHTHEPERPFTNRTHTKTEREFGLELLAELLKHWQPEKIVAIGKVAHQHLSKLPIPGELHEVRHPSYGGETIFADQIKSLYDLA